MKESQIAKAARAFIARAETIYGWALGITDEALDGEDLREEYTKDMAQFRDFRDALRAAIAKDEAHD